jgi:hypothetical protein
MHVALQANAQANEDPMLTEQGHNTHQSMSVPVVMVAAELILTQHVLLVVRVLSLCHI